MPCRITMEKVLAYAPSPGVETYLEAARDYYLSLGYQVSCDDILATYGGSEALQILFSYILEEGTRFWCRSLTTKL